MPDCSPSLTVLTTRTADTRDALSHSSSRLSSHLTFVQQSRFPSLLDRHKIGTSHGRAAPQDIDALVHVCVHLDLAPQIAVHVSDCCTRFALTATFFTGYNGLDTVPSAFVLMGNFQSQPATTASTDYSAIRENFKTLGSIISQYQRLQVSSPLVPPFKAACFVKL